MQVSKTVPRLSHLLINTALPQYRGSGQGEDSATAVSNYFVDR